MEARLWDLERCLITSRPQNLLEREDLGTLRPGDLECCLYWGLKLSERGREDVGTWKLSCYIEVPRYLKIWREDVGTWNAVLLYRGPKISKRGRENVATWSVVLLYRGPKIRGKQDFGTWNGSSPVTAAAPAREENEGALAMAMVGRHRRRSGRSLPLCLLSFSHNPTLIW